MCGIFGIASRENIAPVLVDGLKRLEYRGYDSCGMAVLDAEGLLSLRKGAGEVELVAGEERFHELSGTSALGHTRWATHGRVSRVNAHPHFDAHGEIAIVHNGIIENHESVRRELEERGHTLVSETDSEIVAHLIEEAYGREGQLEEAVLTTLRSLEGTFGIGIISSHEPGVLYAARKESPLLIGISDDFTCFASDPLAFSALTSRVCYLEDGEMVVIDADGFRIRRLDTGSKVKRDPETIDLGDQQTELGQFPDYMSKEIQENATVTRTALSTPNEDIEAISRAMLERPRSMLTGMGTAYYVALMGQYLFARWSGIHVPAISADELPALIRFGPNDHIISISQSGETYDTLRALRPAQKAGATTSAILNVPTSTMAREVDRFVSQKAGPEICVLSTKSTISQLTLLARLALRLGEENGNLSEEELKSLRAELARLPECLDRIWSGSHARLRDMARRLSVIRNWFFLGRGIYYGLAMEAALKFKEVTYCHAEGMPAGFLKHGTISLIDEAMHTAIFLPGDNEEELRHLSLGAVAEINARNGTVVAFQPEGIGDPNGLFIDVIEYPANGPLTNPLLALMQAQLFAYYTARSLGRNVDKPRALAKSVTVG